MTNRPNSCQRTNDELAHVVRMGIALKDMAGKGEAYRYLLRHGVGIDIIERVLDDAGNRRPSDHHCV
jgi:hypothetical protein